MRDLKGIYNGKTRPATVALFLHSLFLFHYLSSEGRNTKDLNVNKIDRKLGQRTKSRDGHLDLLLIIPRINDLAILAITLFSLNGS